MADLACDHRAIRRLRGMYPREGPWVLTRRIWDRDFQPGTAAYYAAFRIFRSWYSIYSVIRKYDARRAQRKAA